jgi:hypothetical protein
MIDDDYNESYTLWGDNCFGRFFYFRTVSIRRADEVVSVLLESFRAFSFGIQYVQ